MAISDGLREESVMTNDRNFCCFFMSKPQLLEFNGCICPVSGVVDSTVALFSDMGQGNFKRRPAARLTLVGDRAVMG